MSTRQPFSYNWSTDFRDEIDAAATAHGVKRNTFVTAAVETFLSQPEAKQRAVLDDDKRRAYQRELAALVEKESERLAGKHGVNPDQPPEAPAEPAAFSDPRQLLSWHCPRALRLRLEDASAKLDTSRAGIVRVSVEQFLATGADKRAAALDTPSAAVG